MCKNDLTKHILSLCVVVVFLCYQCEISDKNLATDKVQQERVCFRIGLRIGKGEGYADMEYGMMASMAAVNESTVVVTVVHDCQVSIGHGM